MGKRHFILTICVAVVMGGALGLRAFDRPVPRASIETQPITYRIHINSADEATLCLLPGVGRGIARHIIAHRDEHGSFTEADDLEAVHMIGPQKRQAIEPWVVFD